MVALPNEPPKPQGDGTEPVIRTVNRAIDAPTVFADSVLMASVLNGMMRVSFVEGLADDSAQTQPGWKNRVVCTLVMPVGSFVTSLKYLQESIEKFQAEGSVPRVE